jgi:hypothetical protein
LSIASVSLALLVEDEDVEGVDKDAGSEDAEDWRFLGSSVAGASALDSSAADRLLLDPDEAVALVLPVADDAAPVVSVPVVLSVAFVARMAAEAESVAARTEVADADEDEVADEDEIADEDEGEDGLETADDSISETDVEVARERVFFAGVSAPKSSTPDASEVAAEYARAREDLEDFCDLLPPSPAISADSTKGISG